MAVLEMGLPVDGQQSELRPERMLEAGQSCPGTMLSARGRDGGVKALPQRMVPVPHLGLLG
jgi:hypothetical protein